LELPLVDKFRSWLAVHLEDAELSVGLLQ
jgi:hypothetical protein